MLDNKGFDLWAGQWMTARYVEVEVLIPFMILCHYNNKIEYNWIIRL